MPVVRAHDPRLHMPENRLGDLRAAVESGEVVAFLAAAVAPNDEVLTYSATTRGVSRLRMIGAMTCTIQALTSGEV